MPAHDGTMLTIGHSTHALEAFVTLLQRHCVTVVADVRAVPYSRFNPLFNREPLADSLAEHGIKHLFLGRELGGRSDDPSCYDNGRICYNRLGGTQSFQDGIHRAVRGAANHRIALNCAEKEPLECHLFTIGFTRKSARRFFALLSESGAKRIVDVRLNAHQVKNNAARLAAVLADGGLSVVTGGTDTHIVLLGLSDIGMTGQAAERVLERSGITTNKNPIPFDASNPAKWSGLRIGVAAATTRGFREAEMEQLGQLISSLLTSPGAGDEAQRIVARLCRSFPLGMRTHDGVAR